MENVEWVCMTRTLQEFWYWLQSIQPILDLVDDS